MNKKNLFALILIFINFFSFSQSLSDGLKELFFKVNVSSILKESDDNTIMAISKLPSDFTNLLMRISWNFENGPSTYFDLIYKIIEKLCKDASPNTGKRLLFFLRKNDTINLVVT